MQQLDKLLKRHSFILRRDIYNFDKDKIDPNEIFTYAPVEEYQS